MSVDPKAYAEKYEALAERYSKAKERLDTVNDDIAKKNARKRQIEEFLHNLESSEKLIIAFDVGLWNTVIDTKP